MQNDNANIITRGQTFKTFKTFFESFKSFKCLTPILMSDPNLDFW